MIGTKRTKEQRQADYEKLYTKIESQQKAGGLGNSLLDICSVELNRIGNLNQVNLVFLNEIPLRTIKVIKKAFDIYSKDFSFSMNYPNLSNNLFD